MRLTASDNKKTKLQFSKRLSIVDTISWLILTVSICALLAFGRAEIAQYCVSIQTTITAAYVSLRLGYTGKAAIENYKKISNTIKDLSSEDDEDDSCG